MGARGFEKTGRAGALRVTQLVLDDLHLLV